MKTPFQNYILQVLQEQGSITPKPIDNLSDFVKDKPRVDASDLTKPVDVVDVDEPVDGDDVEGSDDSGPGTDGNYPFSIPNGLEPGPDEDGDGYPDYFTFDTGDIDADGNPILIRYEVQWIQAEVDGETVAVAMITRDIMGYTLGFANGQWSLIIENSSGVPVFFQNLTLIDWNEQTGYTSWAYQDQAGNFWFTTGDPYGTGVNQATWINPYTGGSAAGEAVDYPAGWGLWLGVEFDANGNPIGANIPLVPGGGYLPPNSNPNNPSGSDWTVRFQVSIPFGGVGSRGWQRHRASWNNFYQWHMETQGGPPPNGGPMGPPYPPGAQWPSWPTGSKWWGNWAEGHL